MNKAFLQIWISSTNNDRSISPENSMGKAWQKPKNINEFTAACTKTVVNSQNQKEEKFRNTKQTKSSVSDFCTDFWSNKVEQMTKHFWVVLRLSNTVSVLHALNTNHFSIVMSVTPKLYYVKLPDWWLFQKPAKVPIIVLISNHLTFLWLSRIHSANWHGTKDMTRKSNLDYLIILFFCFICFPLWLDWKQCTAINVRTILKKWIYYFSKMTQSENILTFNDLNRITHNFLSLYFHRGYWKINCWENSFQVLRELVGV